jgi:methanogenesis multiheme c-type cytochrome
MTTINRYGIREEIMVSVTFRLAVLLLLLAIVPMPATAVVGVNAADSYHGQLGGSTATGMREKWSALYNFSFAQQGGVDGWKQQGCADCHIGAKWNDGQEWPNCFRCHSQEDFMQVKMDGCMSCHVRDSEYRGDLFTADADVHVAADFVCQDCHLRVEDKRSDHQFLKGTAIDTTEPTLEGSLSCTRFCHGREPHQGIPNGDKLNQHTHKIACETCHTGPRPAPALAFRDWSVFASDGIEKSVMKGAGWMPAYKWYDNTGPGMAGRYDQPILDTDERRNVAGARIYPFNVVTVRWFVREPDSALDEVIIVPEVQAADANGNGITTVEEMRVIYPGATLLERDLNLNISHSVRPAREAFSCPDCHGGGGWLLDWNRLGYGGDPGGDPGGDAPGPGYRKPN